MQKAYIRITGEIMGNGILKRKLGDRSVSGKKGQFNSYVYSYDKMSDAILDMIDAYRCLKSDEPDYTEITLSKCQEFLSYDASNANAVDIDI